VGAPKAEFILFFKEMGLADWLITPKNQKKKKKHCHALNTNPL
jgi:hypothetical protein